MNIVVSSNEVQALQRDLNNLKDELHEFKGDVGTKLDTIHRAVLGMARRTWVPGPAAARSARRSSVSNSRPAKRSKKKS